MSDAVPIFEAKNKLPFYIHQVEQNGPVYLSRHNKNVAVLVSSEYFDSLLAQVKQEKSKKSFLERAAEFRQRNRDFYTDEEIDAIFESARCTESAAFNPERDVFKGILEDADD